MAKGTQYSQQLKEDAIRYRKNHPELTLRKIVENLRISESALKNWTKTARENEGAVPTRGSGNYTSDDAKEIVRLQRELRDTKDDLEVLKKQSVSWKNDKSPLYSCIRVCGRNQCPARETPGFCQRDTEKIRCFTIWLPCMEKTSPLRHGDSSYSFKRKNPEDL